MLFFATIYKFVAKAEAQVHQSYVSSSAKVILSWHSPTLAHPVWQQNNDYFIKHSTSEASTWLHE